MPTRQFKPNRYQPSVPRTGEDYGLVFRGKNLILRGNNQSSYYYETYAGSQPLTGETYACKALTGTVTTTLTSRTVTGSGTVFLSELHLGQFILVQHSSGAGSDILVVESIESDTAFTAAQLPTIAASGKTAYRMPVMFEINRKRGALLWGNAVQFDKGNIVAVGDGLTASNYLYINGSVLAGTPTGLTSRTPAMYLFDGSARTYSYKALGFDTPSTTTTTLAVNAATMTRTFTADAGTDVITTNTAHTLRTGTRVQVSSSTTLPGGLAISTDYYAIATGASTMKLASSRENATAGTAVNITDAGTGTHTITFQSDYSMPQGYYAVTVVPANSKTGGWGNPLQTVYPLLTVTSAAYATVSGLPSMQTGQDEWHFFVSPIPYVNDPATDSLYMRTTARYYAGKISSSELGAGTAVSIEWDNALLEGTNRVLSFDNDKPPLAEYVGVLAGVPVYISCYGEATAARKEGIPPGVFVQPTKPNNPEGCPRVSAVPLSPPELILGFQSAVGRLFLMTPKSLQTLIFTANPDAPFTTRPFWQSGFRNPYQLVFINGTLYGWTSVGPTRSIADGDEGSEEHDFASDIEEVIRDWDGSKVMVAHDPQNEAICFIYSGYERNSSNWHKSLILPFYLRQQMWGLPIELSQDNQDMIISGVATVDGHLCFLAGGRKANLVGGTVTAPTEWEVDAYKFDTLAPISVTGVPASDSFTAVNHGLTTGMKVYLNGTFPTQSGGAVFTANTPYYVIWASVDSFQLASSAALAIAGTALAFDTTGSGLSVTFPLDWYCAWQLSDAGDELRAKYVKALRFTGVATGGTMQIYGAGTGETIDPSAIEAGTGGELTTPVSISNTTLVGVSKWHRIMAKNLYAWTVRVAGTWDGNTPKDRIDEIVAEFGSQGVRQ